MLLAGLLASVEHGLNRVLRMDSTALPRLAAGEPVTRVALDLGYASPSAFTRMFRRVLGVSPSEYLDAQG